jgi:hypothetical protein
MCGFGIIPMWVLHFEVKGPTMVSFYMTFDAGIAYWVQLAILVWFSNS